MSYDDVPEAVRELLDRRIESLDQLEVLLLLRKSSDRAWTAEAVGAHLRLPIQVAEALDALQAAGLLGVVSTDSQPQYTYSPVSSHLDHAVTELERQYREEPIRVIKILSAHSIRRVRSKAARAFSEAFAVRPKEDDTGD